MGGEVFSDSGHKLGLSLIFETLLLVHIAHIIHVYTFLLINC